MATSPTSQKESASRIERYAGPIEDPLTLSPGEQFITRGVLLRNRKNIVLAAIVALLLASVLSYFVKPRAPLTELVNPAQELPGFEAVFPGGNDLSKRVIDSFGLAIVLIGSPYTETNVRSLENVRSWAQSRFQAAPDFLHPVSIKPEIEPNDTIAGALCYNLFAGVRYSLETATGELLRGRIAEFHKKPAYKSFAASFFEIYGKDSEAATLLARYQSDKAKEAIDVILWTAAWLGSVACGAAYLLFSPRQQRFERIRHCLVYCWGLAALAYGSAAWMNNSIPSLVSALMATGLALYFLNPFLLLTRQDSSLKIYFIQLSSRWIAFSVWATFTLMAITVLTWIRAGVPDAADPVTLFLSGLSGNFLHDPVEGKRIVARLIAICWLTVSVWAFFQKDRDARVTDALEAELASL